MRSCIAKPSAVENVHRDYLDAGCDVIETNSFGSSSIVLAEYGLAERSYELSFAGARIAREMALAYSQPAHPRFVAGSMGPTTKLPSLGHITFRAMADAYAVQARGLVEGGADLLCIETCQDMLQAKAALFGVFSYFTEARRRVPVIVSVTVESMGTLLLGTEIGAALVTLEPYDVDVIGMNCATGPKEMSEHIRTLAGSCPKPLFIMPNAGIPENIGGHAHYHLTPQEFTASLTHFVKDLGVQVVGGCCGTTPEHIRQLVPPWRFAPCRPNRIRAASFSLSVFRFRSILRPGWWARELYNANGASSSEILPARRTGGDCANGRSGKEGAHGGCVRWYVAGMNGVYAKSFPVNTQVPFDRDDPRKRR